MQFHVDLSKVQLPQDIEVEILRYAPRDHHELRKFACLSFRHADLLRSFPAACVVYARQRGCVVARTEALALLHQGASLQAVGNMLDLPGWIRKLPPEALHLDLPAVIGKSRGDEEFGRLLARPLQQEFEAGCSWLGDVLAAREAGGDEFAAWLSRFLPPKESTLFTQQIRMLGAYAFYSASERARWSKRSSLNAALAMMSEWFSRAMLDFQAVVLEAQACPSLAYHADGFEFVRLYRYKDIVDEGKCMNHCVADYTRNVAEGYSVFFSVQFEAGDCATVEITSSRLNGAVDRIHQINGPHNCPASAHVLFACDKWFRAIRDVPSLASPREVRILPDVAAWKAYWAPYWTQYGGHELIRPDTTAAALNLMFDAANAAARKIAAFGRIVRAVRTGAT